MEQRIPKSSELLPRFFRRMVVLGFALAVGFSGLFAEEDVQVSDLLVIFRVANEHHALRDVMISLIAVSAISAVSAIDSMGRLRTVEFFDELVKTAVQCIAMLVLLCLICLAMKFVLLKPGVSLPTDQYQPLASLMGLLTVATFSLEGMLCIAEHRTISYEAREK